MPGSENEGADKESRVFNDSTEWRLNKDVFAELIKMHTSPDIDLFASRLNKQVEKICVMEARARCDFHRCIQEAVA